MMKDHHINYDSNSKFMNNECLLTSTVSRIFCINLLLLNRARNYHIKYETPYTTKKKKKKTGEIIHYIL